MRSSSIIYLNVVRMFDWASFATATESNLSIVLDPSDGLEGSGDCDMFRGSCRFVSGPGGE